MGANIIGLPSASATSKVLRRQGYEKDSNGLETITETYLIQSQNLLGIIPEKDTTHSSFSSAVTKFPRMAVESISTTEQDGGITELNIKYVGLTSSSGLPPAVVSVIPATGAGIFGPPINIQVEFISDLTDFQILRGQFSSLSPNIAFSGKETFRMPKFINGTALPDNPKEPFKQEGVSSVSSFYYRYEGYISNNLQTTKRGQFRVVIATFAEFAATVGGTSGGWALRFGS